ncbi:MAG TPA: lysylphosphatidylglycerol synthase domain-containing protein [Gaiellaceae bacterium]|nr:lysylphosphatidylglycerol synthase domain-containing protein [Gaiellaceae bacterium]
MGGLDLRREHLVLPLVASAAVLVAALSPHLFAGRVEAALDVVASATAAWLWVAAAAFAAALVSAACAWRHGLACSGAGTSRTDASARYCVGSFVNAFAPARVGSALRFLLFAQVVHGEGRLWTTGGVAASVGAARALWTAALIGFAAAAGVVPAWPVAALLAAAAGAAALAWLGRRRGASRRLAHAFAAFAALGRTPRAALTLVGWVGAATASRVAAAAAVAAAFGIDRPLAAALLVVPALDLAGLLPLTPGNVGIATAAIAFALAAHGAAGDVALAAGIAFAAVETATSVVCGSLGLVCLAAGTTGARRWTAAAAGATASVGVAVAFGATVLAPLV